MPGLRCAASQPARRFACAVLAWAVLGGAEHAAAAGLEQWLDEELIPFLERRFGQHPRLRGEPFEVRVVRDGRVVARMDGLSAYLRRRIEDALQAVPGAELLRPVPAEPWTAPRHLRDLACPSARRPAVRLTVEVEPGPAAQGARVSIQAVDLRESSWIGLLSRDWRGELEPSQRRRLQEQAIDRRLLGSRELPFRQEQPDLLAARLAISVGCRLRRSGRTQRTVHLSPAAPAAPAFFDKVAVLLEHHLSALRGVRAVAAAEAARIRLGLLTHRIDADRYQVWLSIADDAGGGLVESGAAAYVALAGADPPAGTATASGAEAAPALIAAFQLIAPRAQRACDSPRPWSEGRIVLERSARLRPGGCFAIRYRAAGASRLYLFTQTGDGAPTRLLPNACNLLRLGRGEAPLGAGETLHIPLFQDGSPGYFRLDAGGGVERLYALAVRGERTPAELEALLEQTADPCAPEPGATAGENGAFAARLQQLVRALGAGAQWAARTLVHEGAR